MVYVANPRFLTHHFADAFAFETTTATSASAINGRPMSHSVMS
jgi:hypothetical protein